MKLADVKEGMKLKADGGFTCIRPGAVLTVKFDEEGFPFVPCHRGGHWLNGQVDGDGTIIGFEPAAGAEGA
jgi:hypothetical protein